MHLIPYKPETLAVPMFLAECMFGLLQRLDHGAYARLVATCNDRMQRSSLVIRGQLSYTIEPSAVVPPNVHPVAGCIIIKPKWPLKPVLVPYYLMCLASPLLILCTLQQLGRSSLYYHNKHTHCNLAGHDPSTSSG